MNRLVDFGRENQNTDSSLIFHGIFAFVFKKVVFFD